MPKDRGFLSPEHNMIVYLNIETNRIGYMTEISGINYEAFFPWKL